MLITIKDHPNEVLQEGRHNVTITEVLEGITPNSVEYFAPRFGNEKGSILGRLYVTEPSQFRIIELFRVCNIEYDSKKQLNTDNLIGKRLTISVEKKERNEKVIYDVTKFEKIVEDSLIQNDEPFTADDLPF